VLIISAVTYSDFEKIKYSGFNLVRIPVGFWAFEVYDTPYVTGASDYLERAIEWSRTLGLKVIIDLHGAPGSQNGYDNSGERLTGEPQWQSGNTVDQTYEILQHIADRFTQPEYQDVVVGIQLLNEPFTAKLNEEGLRQFYVNGHAQIRKSSDTLVILHDGFKAPSAWNNFLTPSDSNGHDVAIDHHEYQVFDNSFVSMQPWQHRQLVCNNAGSYSGADKMTFVGEWTGAMTDCAKYLNGYGIGARYDGTYSGSSYVGDCSWRNNIEQWSQEFRNDTRGYIEAQMDVFEAKTQGWAWWNFKTESAAEWDAFKLIDAGIFPQPLTDRKFGPVCDHV
jgi:glucan 1,3-beta-glucosidase